MVIIMYNRTLEGSFSDLGIMKKIHVVNSIPQILVQHKHLENVILAQSALYIILCWLVYITDAFATLSCLCREFVPMLMFLCSYMMDS